MTDPLKPRAMTLHATVQLAPSTPLPVYRVINGERVRVPGDQPDPNRRYSHTHDGQNEYLLEFTDQEEKAAADAASAWIAGEPLREAERIRQEKERKKFVDSLVYEDRITAFIDVLGWAEALEQSTQSPDIAKNLGIALNSLAIHASMFEFQNAHGAPEDPRITQFSDCIVLSFAAHHYSKSSLESTLGAIVLMLFNNGFLARGGVTYGKLIHRSDMVYGPALVDAYFLERDVASSPRIILSGTLADNWGGGSPIHDLQQNLLGYQNRWRQDDDGLFFLDYLGDPFGTRMLGVENSQRVPPEFMARWHRFIAEHIAKYSCAPKILKKYIWLARYFNKVCEEDPDAKHELVVLPAS